MLLGTKGNNYNFSGEADITDKTVEISVSI